MKTIEFNYTYDDEELLAKVNLQSVENVRLLNITVTNAATEELDNSSDCECEVDIEDNYDCYEGYEEQDEYDYCDVYEQFSISEYGPTDIVIAKISNGYYISFADMCSSAPKLLSLDDVDFLAELAHDATYRGVYSVAIALAINLIAQEGF